MNEIVPSHGKLIVAMGLPACGKSSVFEHLSRLHKITVFHEPEEKDWPAAVTDRDVCGRFTAITWFRSQRVPQLFAAKLLRDAGENVLVDSYYDKLIAYYIDRPEMEWLISKDDPYYNLTSEIAKADVKYLPNADVVVFFKLNIDTWRRFLNSRNRRLDRHPQFLESFPSQEYFEYAADTYCSNTGATLIKYEQRFSSPDEAAADISQLFRENGLDI